VLLNTARSLTAVKDRAEQFALLGGVASFGAAIWDNVYKRESRLISSSGEQQLAALSEVLQSDQGFVLDPTHTDSVRASRVVDGRIATIPAPEARALLDRNGFTS